MTDLVEIGADVEWPDNEAAASLRARRATDADQGALDEHAEWLAGVQGSDPPRDFRRVRVVAFHGAGCNPDVTGLAAATVRCAGSLPESTAEAIAAGIALADEEIDGGADLLIAALPAAGTEAAVLVSVLTNTEPVKVLPRTMAPDAWMAQTAAVRDGRRRAYALRGSPAELLAAAGTPELAAATGFVLRAATRRTPVLLDGLFATVAALVAYEAQPRAVRWWRAADLSTHPAHAIALTRLGQQPILNLGTTLADGTAGVLATAVLRAAVQISGAPQG